MDINKYTSHFHDGGIIDINQSKDKIEISMESAPLRSEWNKDNISLSYYKTIRGKLHLEGVKNITISHIPIKQLKMIYDSADILKLNIYNDTKIVLLVTWINFLPKEPVHKFEDIEILAEKIYWENIPDLLDSMDLPDE